MKAQQDMILLTKLQSDIQHLNLEVSELMKCLQVSYSEVLPNKTMVATLFLVNKESGSKFQIAIGNADCFFEERFNTAYGEKFSYEDAIKKAKSFIEQFVYFKHFLRIKNNKDNTLFEDLITETTKNLIKPGDSSLIVNDATSFKPIEKS